LHTANFIDATVAAELELDAGRYVIGILRICEMYVFGANCCDMRWFVVAAVPSTFDEGVECEFELTAYGANPLALAPYGGKTRFKSVGSRVY
jgi:hypothetical protein